MHVRVLGPLSVSTATGELGLRGPKQRLLFTTLLLHAPRVVTSERLIEILWRRAEPQDAGAALRTQVSRLRSALAEVGEEGRLRTVDPSGYVFDLAGVLIDAVEIEDLYGRARSVEGAAEALAVCDEALALWRGDPFSEFRDEPQFVGERSRLQELHNGLREVRAQLLAALGSVPEAVSEAELLVRADPLRERSRGLLMQMLVHAGRQADALATFQDYRRLLSQELGLSPSAALRALEQEVIQHPGSGSAPLPRFRAAAPHVPGERRASLHDFRQDIRFATASDDVTLAYATVGAGPPLVKAANWLNHLEFDWESPVWRRLFRELAARRTLIRYDERGSGLSDWDPPEISLDAWVRDLECVVDACGLERFPLLGISQGCAVCIEYAARHPQRVSGLILHGGYAAGWRADPSYGPAEIARRDASIEIVRHGWGEDTPAYRQMFTQTFIPGGTPDEIEWFNELQRRTVSPENAARFMEAFAWIDVRDRLAAVRAPTLVLHSRGDQRIHYSKGRELATSIPGARFVLLESRNHLILEHEPAFEEWMQEALRFLAGELADDAPVTRV